MTVEFILIAGGVLLILAALFGGGFKVKEVEVPQVKGFVRFISGFFGSALIALGIWIQSAPKPDPLTPQPDSISTSTETENYARFTVYAEFGEENIELDQTESWDISIDGQYKGRINVSPTFPSAQIVIEVLEGRHSFDVTGKVYWLDNKEWQEINCYGQGSIDVGQGDLFLVDGTKDPGALCIATLHEQ